MRTAAMNAASCRAYYRMHRTQILRQKRVYYRTHLAQFRATYLNKKRMILREAMAR